MSEKVILDTDIGSDIDDAVCLAYLLAQPECELMGITTVSGDVGERAMIADAMCRVANQKIPVLPGLAKPLYKPTMQPDVPQAKALGRWPHAEQFPEGEAIDFLRRTIRANPGEITLLAIGPLTNLAALFALDPGIPALLKGLFIMGGQFTPTLGEGVPSVACEWNIHNDAAAAELVYNTPVARHYSYGLEVTTRVTMDSAEVRRRFKSPLLAITADLAEVWFASGAPKITFHDPLAGAGIFQPDICTYRRGTVRVEATGTHTEGFTQFSPAPEGPCTVAYAVDSDRFFRHFFSILGESSGCEVNNPSATDETEDEAV